jgi:hypothetical protein
VGEEEENRVEQGREGRRARWREVVLSGMFLEGGEE